MAQEGSKEENDEETEESEVKIEEAHVRTEEKLEEVDLGTDLQKPRPISTNSKLSEEEKSDLI